jgi:hypothetical protein
VAAERVLVDRHQFTGNTILKPVLQRIGYAKGMFARYLGALDYLLG